MHVHVCIKQEYDITPNTDDNDNDNKTGCDVFTPNTSLHQTVPSTSFEVSNLHISIFQTSSTKRKLL